MADDIDNKIKEAELVKLLAEIDKIKSEKQKIDIERSEIEKPLYKKLRFLQAVVAGIVGGLAILGISSEIIKPAYDRDIIKSQVENAKQEMEISKQMKINDAQKVVNDVQLKQNLAL